MYFRKEYAFLSNFYTLPIRINGLNFTCVEAAYQSFKTTDMELRKRFEGLSGKEAKILGKNIPLRADWNHVKVQIMRSILDVKFRNQKLAQQLIQVKGEIKEENTWGDMYWGMCDGRGTNMLGQLLMEKREQLLKQIKVEEYGKETPMDREQMEDLYMEAIKFDDNMGYTDEWTAEMDNSLMDVINHTTFNEKYVEPLCKTLARELYDGNYSAEKAYKGFLTVAKEIPGSFTQRQKEEMAKVLMETYKETVVNQADNLSLMEQGINQPKRSHARGR